MTPLTLRICRWAAACGAALLTLGTAGVPAAAAGPTGYVRLAHLSPDTPNVDVYLASVSGAIPEKVFPGVGYGVVSDYLALPTGAYAVAMRNAGAAASTPAVLTTQVEVVAGKAYTVAGVGRHADLGLRVSEDDLSLPSGNTAKLRVAHASVRAPVLDVAVTGGPTIAQRVEFATTTPYQQVTPGNWTLELRPPGGTVTKVAVTLGSGEVYTLLVLDGSDGALVGRLQSDAQRSGPVPAGGMDTGAGGDSRSTTGQLALWVGAGLLGAVALLFGARMARQPARRPVTVRPARPQVLSRRSRRP